MLSAVRVDAEDVRAILSDDPDLLRPNDEFVDVREIQDSRETVRKTAQVDRIWKDPFLDCFDVLLISRLPLVVVRRSLSNARFSCTPVGWFHRRGVEHGRSHHLP